MKKKTLSYILCGLAGCIIFFTLIRLTKPTNAIGSKRDELYENYSEPVLGVYDRNKKMTNEKVAAFKHFTIKWNDSQEDKPVQKQLSNILKEKQDILLTVEMWSERGEAYAPHGILQGMVDGEYDKKIIALCSSLAAGKNNIYLRWNPEMEVPVQKYQWQNQSVFLYANAFCHFAGLCKKLAPAAKIVWGPLGYAGALEYWPGSDAADFACITLNNLPASLSPQYPAEKSIPVQIKRKLHRLRFIDKPIFILGSEEVKKDNFNNQWIEAAIQDIRKDTAIIYSQKNFVRPDSANINGGGIHLLLGMYDPGKQLINQPLVGIEHIFADWGNIQDGTFRKIFNGVISRNHNVIVTIEPWKSKNHTGDRDVLNNTLNGSYDTIIKELYNIISNVKQTVYLRWAHEMEIPVDRYFWQNQDPVTYIKAYRYVMKFNKNKAKNIRNVWGPTGDRGALDFWPGNDVVDYISIAIYGLPNKDITDPDLQESFSTIFKRKYSRMSFVNKPVFITEFGVKGSQAFKRKWLKDAAATINENPRIAGVCYFNFSDVPKAWGKIEPPDWSITKETFQHFTSELKQVKQKRG